MPTHRSSEQRPLRTDPSTILGNSLLQELRMAAADAVAEADVRTLALILVLAERCPCTDASATEADGVPLKVDLTVAQVAEMFGRSPQTVRGWIRQGELEAYQLNNREYRVTRAALQGYQERARGAVATSPGHASVDLSAWKQDRGKEGSGPSR